MLIVITTPCAANHCKILNTKLLRSSKSEKFNRRNCLSLTSTFWCTVLSYFVVVGLYTALYVCMQIWSKHPLPNTNTHTHPLDRCKQYFWSPSNSSSTKPIHNKHHRTTTIYHTHMIFIQIYLK